MSDKKHEEAPAAEPKAASSGGSMLGKIVMALFMGGVILSEVVLVMFFLPDPKQVATLASAEIAKKHAVKTDEEEEGDHHDGDAEIAEVLIGEFDVTASQPASSTTLRISFKLYGTVTRDDEDKFSELKTANEHRWRDRVIYEVRNAEIADITDPGLGLIKRRILEKSNALLGKPLLRSIMFSDFAFVEQ